METRRAGLSGLPVPVLALLALVVGAVVTVVNRTRLGLPVTLVLPHARSRWLRSIR